MTAEPTMVNRRTSPGGALAGGAALAPASCGDSSAVRDGFILSPNRVHFSALFIASHPRPVRGAIERHRRALDELPVNYLIGEIGERENRVPESAGRCLPEELPRDCRSPLPRRKN